MKSAFERKLTNQASTLTSMKSLLQENLVKQKEEIKSSMNDKQDGAQKELADFETFVRKSIETQ